MSQAENELPSQNVKTDLSFVPVKSQNIAGTVSLPQPQPLRFQQGNTVALPNDSPLLLVYPRTGDPPGGVYMTSPNFISTIDPILSFGWNYLFEDPSQPRALFGIEFKYEQPAGVFNMEMYWEVRSSGFNPRRPFFAIIDRSTAPNFSYSPSAMYGDGPTDAFKVVDLNSVPIFVAGRAGMTIGTISVPSEIDCTTFLLNATSTVTFIGGGTMAMQPSSAGEKIFLDSDVVTLRTKGAAARLASFDLNADVNTPEMVLGNRGVATAVRWVQCAGSPEGVVSAGLGSLASDTTNGELYIKKTGTGNTGWKLVTHA